VAGNEIPPKAPQLFRLVRRHAHGAHERRTPSEPGSRFSKGREMTWVRGRSFPAPSHMKAGLPGTFRPARRSGSVGGLILAAGA